jgi:hypothetical protein
MASLRIEILRVFSRLYLEPRFAYFPGEAFVTCNCSLARRNSNRLLADHLSVRHRHGIYVDPSNPIGLLLHPHETKHQPD